MSTYIADLQTCRYIGEVVWICSCRERRRDPNPARFCEYCGDRLREVVRKAEG